MENTNQSQHQPSDTNEKGQEQTQQPGEKFNTDGGLKKSGSPDIPDSTNESTGATGSGQRQDSN